MKNWQHLTYCIVIGILVFLLLKNNDSPDNTKQLESENLKSEAIIKDLQKANDSIEIQKIVKEKQIDSLKLIVLKLKGEVIIINKEADEKINLVDGYNAGELQKFFTERYPRK